MENLVSQGLELAAFGMGTVFIFLTVLIFVTRLMSFLVLKFQPIEASMPAATATQAKGLQDSQLIAVISAAIKQHRKNSH